MKKSTLIAMGLLGALPMTFATSNALAQQPGDGLQRVEISGSKLPEITRYDVSKVCPGVARSLQDSLAVTAYREDMAATLRVNFRLTGNKVEDVRSSGPSAYRVATRQAVRKLDCADAGSSQPQNFSFLISFNRPDELGNAPSRVALLER